MNDIFDGVGGGIVSKEEKILILSGNYGDGHQQAANAIQEALRINRPDIETIVIDFMKWTHPYFNPISRYVFIQGVKKFPSVYGYLYRKTKTNNSFSMTLKKLNRLGISRMLKLLHIVQPIAVVSTFPLSAGAMSVLKGYGLTDVPTVTVITDHTDHSYWIHPFTDQYIVGSHIVRRGLNQYSIANDKISVTGIPIRPEFCNTYQRDILKSKHGLNPSLPTILLMGGGCGIIGDGVSLLLALESLPKKVQLIIVCGHNVKLRQQLEEKLQHSKHDILLTGYIDFVHELMAVSDLMITKPGGLSTSEAIAQELPMLLYRPLPGQEQDNAKYLLKSGVAMQANNISELVDGISNILCYPQLTLQMKRNAKSLHKKKSAFDAVYVITQTIINKQNKKNRVTIKSLGL